MRCIHSKSKGPHINEMIFLVVGFMLGFILFGILFVAIPKINQEQKERYKWERIESAFVPLDVPMEEDLQKDIFLLSHSYELPFTLVMALIQQESNFQTDVVSTTKDWGLMQINEINHPSLEKKLEINNFLNPYQNIQAGLYILNDLFDKYKKPHLVLMAYNLGETGAKRLWRQKIHQTEYSKNILRHQKEFQKYLEKNT